MTKPSKGTALFVAFFGLMFLVPGVLALFTFLANRNSASASGKTAGAGIAVFISAIGGVFVFGALAGYGRLKKQAALEEANPAAPWLWRADWASRRSESLKKNIQITAWVICGLCNLVDRKSTRLNSSHPSISYAVFCLKKKKTHEKLA